MTDNVLQYFVSLDNGGAENRIMDVYHHIDSAVVTFDFAVMEDKEHFFDAQVKEKGSQKIIFPHPRNGIIKNYKTLKQFFTEHKEDYLAVHTHVSWYSGVVLLAAKRAGIKHLILCKDNRKDIDEIPDMYIHGLDFHYVETVMDVLDYALLAQKVEKPVEFILPKEDKDEK